MAKSLMKKTTLMNKKEKVKYVVFKILHILGYCSLVAWGLLGLLYSCGVSKQNQQQDHNEQKQAIRHDLYKGTSTSNMLKSFNDIKHNDVYVQSLTNVSAEYVTSKYKAYADFDYLYTYNDYVHVSCSVSPLTFLKTYAYNLNNGYQYDYNTYDYSTNIKFIDTNNYANNGDVVINYQNNNYQIINLEVFVYNFAQSNVNITYDDLSLRMFLTVKINNSVTQVYSFLGGYYNDDYFMTCDSRNDLEILKELFSGKYNYAKILYDSRIATQYQRFIYLFSTVSSSNFYAHTNFEYDSLSWLGLMYYSSVYQEIYGGYVFRLDNASAVQFMNRNYITALEGDFYYNGSYYNRINLNYGYVTCKSYESIKIIDSISTISSLILDTTLINSNPRYYYFYLRSVCLVNSLNYNTADLCNFNVFSSSYIDNTGSTPYDNDVLNYSIEFYNSVNNQEFYVGAVVPQMPFISYGLSDNEYKLGKSTFVNGNYNQVWSNSMFYICDYFLDYTELSYVNANNGGNEINQDSVYWLYNSFQLISLALTGIMGLLGVYILPNVSIGALLLVPFLLTIFMFIIKLFKR